MARGPGTSWKTKGPPGPKSKIKAWGLVRWKLAKEANDGRYGQMAIAHQRGPIGHKRYCVANWPQLGSRLELPPNPWRRVNLRGCDKLAQLGQIHTGWLIDACMDQLRCPRSIEILDALKTD
ncbi:hypothetical protein O181_050285 [Austropuccinia psidii MF-1]|uniref:Uncharacterized protein n=1 Tax=Austropuccinia psidii MF-1 TaxID=1389203 RepID=A0A9Q3DV21_9BASI|nr:hypothetical protein [Austropuccinia psidii MF-1]